MYHTMQGERSQVRQGRREEIGQADRIAEQRPAQDRRTERQRLPVERGTDLDLQRAHARGGWSLARPEEHEVDEAEGDVDHAERREDGRAIALAYRSKGPRQRTAASRATAIVSRMLSMTQATNRRDVLANTNPGAPGTGRSWVAGGGGAHETSGAVAPGWSVRTGSALMIVERGCAGGGVCGRSHGIGAGCVGAGAAGFVWGFGRLLGVGRRFTAPRRALIHADPNLPRCRRRSSRAWREHRARNQAKSRRDRPEPAPAIGLRSATSRRVGWRSPLARTATPHQANQ